MVLPMNALSRVHLRVEMLSHFASRRMTNFLTTLGQRTANAANVELGCTTLRDKCE